MALDSNSTSFHPSCWLQAGSFCLSLNYLPATYFSLFYGTPYAACWSIFWRLKWHPNSSAQATKTSTVWLHQPFQPSPLTPYTPNTLNLSPSPGHTRSFQEIRCHCICSVPLPKVSSILPTVSWKTSPRPSKPNWNVNFFDEASSILPDKNWYSFLWTRPTAPWARRWLQGLQRLQGHSALRGAPQILSKRLPCCLQPFGSQYSIKFQMAVSYHDGWFLRTAKQRHKSKCTLVEVKLQADSIWW